MDRVMTDKSRRYSDTSVSRTAAEWARKVWVERVGADDVEQEYVDDLAADFDAYACQQVREALEPYLVLATAAEEFWSECWDVSLPTVKKFSKALKAIAALRGGTT